MRNEDVTRRFGVEGGEFFVTAPAPCPYLPGKTERKVFSHLNGPAAPAMNAMLTRRGFRRSQNIIYLPACERCQACVPVRVVTEDFAITRSRRRVLARNADLVRRIRAPRATGEQFSVLRAYLDARHHDGGMADMTVLDYVSMVEETAVDTMIVEYALREPSGEERLVAAALTDRLTDGLSMVYSFFEPEEARRSLGQFMILDHVALARDFSLPYVYLGYWVEGSPKMDYKKAFQPLEMLTASGWVRMDRRKA
ncbi:arginyltransferase [Amphiplicatus metriothermophilus]|uniref:Aspartate/glutamate leucyltransferase n=1 Tax=Amphiplicatus metriothermophilus TaxID=1519374 RepID=A0A239PYD7_9PROT|nr:arginyltransferase [Amphiplicatus metriothermophilus]MBB5519841.1 arginine-tRNA-protein transferase [Amphiplicatus metriothermophilus]SNT75108.1 arginine-tRNA-protein transferase [Amphiplicatus metriothermophilus]